MCMSDVIFCITSKRKAVRLKCQLSQGITYIYCILIMTQEPDWRLFKSIFSHVSHTELKIKQIKPCSMLRELNIYQTLMP